MSVPDRREREFRRREEDILAAALALLSRDEWRSVTIERIAAKAEIGKGTVYKHFASKDEICARLVVEFHRRVMAEIRAVDPTKPPPAVVGETMTAFWRAHAREPERRRLARRCRRKDFRRRISDRAIRELAELDAELASLLSAALERGVREGHFLEKPAGSLMIGLYAALLGLMELEGGERARPHSPSDRIYEETRDFALRAISRQ